MSSFAPRKNAPIRSATGNNFKDLIHGGIVAVEQGAQIEQILCVPMRMFVKDFQRRLQHISPADLAHEFCTAQHRQTPEVGVEKEALST